MKEQMQVIDAELCWTGTRFERNVQVTIGPDGRITAVGELGLDPTRTLRGQALLPGMISAHSHAFQRGLRGRGETFPATEGSFWSWREAMYELVTSLDPEAFYGWTLRAFREMRRAGITTVGEFHYLHHSVGSRDYLLDDLVVQASREAGIRLVLLNTFYRRGGIGKALTAAQKRFVSGSMEEFWAHMDELDGRLDHSTQSLGVAAHSIRAVSIEEIDELYGESMRRLLPFHMHVEEQRQEIEECMAAHGKSPMALLNERLEITGGFTAVHCTHTEVSDLRRFLNSGGHVCITPLTEGNLGDGIQKHVNEATRRICLGTDSNARIGMIEEMRWLEYVQRLAGEKRGIFRDFSGRVARMLFDIASYGGAKCLGLNTGKIAPGASADLLTLDLGSPLLEGWTEESLLDMVVFGGNDELILQTAVNGHWQEHRLPA
ncbi:MAG TPA: formimidoylglutamate deiminase [Thermoanaerobaculia bacterium]|nr:formimidoylglutamate deiminase [Thermoanaerobaculia bacterium]